MAIYVNPIRFETEVGVNPINLKLDVSVTRMGFEDGYQYIAVEVDHD